MNELFTIIICFKNPSFKHLEICFESLHKQKFKNFSCVLINDGSDSKANYYSFIKSKIGNINFYYHENKKNLGLGISRDIGIGFATGDYILFLDADDFLTIDCLEYLYKKIYEISDLDLICFNYMELYENCFESKSKLIKQKEIKEEIFFNNVSKKMTKYLFDKFQTDWRYCYRKKFLIENSIHHKKENIFFEDVVFNLLCKNSFNKILCTTKKIYFYNRSNLDSIIRSFGSKEAAQIIFDNLIWTSQILKFYNLLTENFFFYILYFFRQFVLINDSQKNWISLKEFLQNNKFVSLKYLNFKTWFICKFLVLSKKIGKKISQIVEKRDAKIKKEILLKKIITK